MTQKKKNNIIIGSLCAVVLLMAVGYAAFSSILNIKGTSSISSNWKVLITNVVSKNIVGSASNKEEPSWEDLTATFKTNLVSPGDSIEYDITIENRGNLNAKLDKITLTDSNNEAIKFTSSGLEEGTELNAGGTATLTVKVEYDNNVTSQPENTEGTFTVTLDYSQKEGTSGTPGGETAADKLIATETTSGDGLYADEYETGRYIYKGTNPNNYITFNNETWRILSVENDGTLKIMKKDYIATRSWGSSSNFGSWTSTSTLNTYLNSTYYNSLSSEARGLIQTHTWSVGRVTPNNTDLADQIISENGTTWSGNIGLISVSDAIRANYNTTQCGNLSLNNNNTTTCRTTNYILLISRSSPFWTIAIDASNRNNALYTYYGKVNSQSTSTTNTHVFPALYLVPNITLSGEGTSTNPYTIIPE